MAERWHDNADDQAEVECPARLRDPHVEDFVAAGEMRALPTLSPTCA
jgi:hypothetical protein